MKKIYYILIIIAACFWGCIGVFTRTLGEVGFLSSEMCLVRSVVSTVLIGIIYLVKDRSVFRLEKITDLKYFIGMGIISFAFFNWCYLITIEETSLAVAAILLYTAPSIIMILSVILFKEKLTKKKVLILMITFTGCVLVTGLDGGANAISAKGLFFGLCSGAGYALYSIFGKYALKKYSAITCVFYTFLMSCIPFCIATNPVQVAEKFTDTNMWGMGIMLGIVAAAVPYLTYTSALAHVEASKASMIATLEPVVAAILGIVIFAENVSVNKILGMVLVIGAVCAMSIEKK